MRKAENGKQLQSIYSMPINIKISMCKPEKEFATFAIYRWFVYFLLQLHPEFGL